jgi:hypothetical protein
METVRHGWQLTDLRFVVDALVPERRDPDHLIHLLQEDHSLRQAMLEDDRLFHRLMDEDSTLDCVSPLFLFRVLLLRARRDIERELHACIQRTIEPAALADAHRIIAMLAHDDMREYLAWLLATFTQIETETIQVQIRDGISRQIRINDLDIDSLLLYSKVVKPEHRFGIYRRIADACLFLTGVLPEYVEAHRFYPALPEPRYRLASTALPSLEDLEGYGRTFYRMAAEHPQAQQHDLTQVLSTLSEEFVLAEKPLAFIAQRYLTRHRRRLFPI